MCQLPGADIFKLNLPTAERSESRKGATNVSLSLSSPYFPSAVFPLVRGARRLAGTVRTGNILVVVVARKGVEYGESRGCFNRQLGRPHPFTANEIERVRVESTSVT